jgi:hypothetical protein
VFNILRRSLKHLRHSSLSTKATCYLETVQWIHSFEIEKIILIKISSFVSLDFIIIKRCVHSRFHKSVVHILLHIFELSIALFVVVNGEVMYIEAITIVSKRRHPWKDLFHLETRIINWQNEYFVNKQNLKKLAHVQHNQ